MSAVNLSNWMQSSIGSFAPIFCSQCWSFIEWQLIVFASIWLQIKTTSFAKCIHCHIAKFWKWCVQNGAKSLLMLLLPTFDIDVHSTLANFKFEILSLKLSHHFKQKFLSWKHFQIAEKASRKVELNHSFSCSVTWLFKMSTSLSQSLFCEILQLQLMPIHFDKNFKCCTQKFHNTNSAKLWQNWAVVAILHFHLMFEVWFSALLWLWWLYLKSHAVNFQHAPNETQMLLKVFQLKNASWVVCWCIETVWIWNWIRTQLLMCSLPIQKQRIWNCKVSMSFCNFKNWMANAIGIKSVFDKFENLSFFKVSETWHIDNAMCRSLPNPKCQNNHFTKVSATRKSFAKQNVCSMWQQKKTCSPKGNIQIWVPLFCFCVSKVLWHIFECLIGSLDLCSHFFAFCGWNTDHSWWV